MPGKDETVPGFKSVDPSHRLLNSSLGSAIRELPNEFGIFDDDGRLIAASTGLIERCGLKDVTSTAATLDETLRRLAMKIVMLDGEQIQQPDILAQSVFGRLESFSNRAIEVEFRDGAWRLLHLFSISTGGHILQCADISHKKEAEASARRSTDVVRRVLEACPFALVMARLKDLSIIYESPANNEMFAEAENTKAQHIGVYDVDPARRIEYLEKLRKYRFVNNFEMRFKGQDGNEFVGALSGRLIDFEGEQVIVSGAVDLTERQAVEKKLAQQREALFQSEKLSALGELLAGISHELNNPLSVLVGHSQLLKETTSDPKIARRVEKINSAADRCARIVKSFLAMARQQSGRHESVDMNQVIRSALEVTNYSLRSADIVPKLDTADRLPVVSGDSDQLEQVMVNLIINAQHALGEIEGSRLLCLETSYCGSGGQVVVNVKDNGPGIPADLIQRIFEPLFTTKEAGSGTGIGLTLCHRIIESHGGTIAAQSLPDHETIFTIRLPAVLGEKTASEITAEPKLSAMCLKVLVIDDDSDVATLIRDILSCDGHICEIASSGPDALGALNRTRFDVILSDIRMPEMSGQTLYSIISEELPDLIPKIGFITGDNLNEKCRTFLMKAQRPYIEKPITSNEIRGLIREIVAP